MGAGVAIRLHYFRGGYLVSPRRKSMGSIDMPSKSAWKRITAALAGALGAVVLVSPIAAWPQYPGQVSKKSKDAAPELRAVAVLEWTGDLGKPKAARIIPVTIFDGEKLQD